MKIWIWVKENIFSINETKSLHENWSFWSAIILPFIPVLFFALPLFEEVTLQSNVSATGYVVFIEVFSFPLWIVSSSLVFGIMVGRFHGSKQRAKAIIQRDATIEETRKQNEFSNYLNHRDHFHKYLQPIAENYDLKVDAFKIYSIFFSNSTPYSVDINIANNVFEKKFNELLWDKLKKNPSQTYEELDMTLQGFSKSIGILSIVEVTRFDDKIFESILSKYQNLYSAVIEYSFEKKDTQEIANNNINSLVNSFNIWIINNVKAPAIDGSNLFYYENLSKKNSDQSL